MTRKVLPIAFLIGVVSLLTAYAPVGSAAGVSRSQALERLVLAHITTQSYQNASTLKTATPIKHVIVLFQENVSFDHYFATYPHAANLKGERAWHAKKGTPTVNGLTSALLTHNPNSHNPIRLAPAQALTCDMDHSYTPEQKAEDNGLMDKFVQYTQGSAHTPYQNCPTGSVMGYFDGNTVTAFWNYAQNFAMSDHYFDTNFGPSTPGALHLVSGDTGTALCGTKTAVINASSCTSTPPTGSGTGTTYGDADPYWDACSDSFKPNPANEIAMSGPNIGTMLDSAKVTWGWFQGGFGDCMSASPPKHGPVLALKAQSPPVTVSQDPGDQSTDYSPHHEPFQYYEATANPMHLLPTSTSMVGSQDQANHQYDINSFWAAADSGHLPAVSFLKAPRFQDGHAANSDPLDEQNYLVSTINRIEKLSTWSSTALIITYDDSDGWYDHLHGQIVNQSNSSIDWNCGTTPAGTPSGRCGYGPRLPFVLISPYARQNFVGHSTTDQTSIIRFIEDNWLKGNRVSSQSFDRKAGSINGMFNFKLSGSKRAPEVFMNPLTGQITSIKKFK